MGRLGRGTFTKAGSYATTGAWVTVSLKVPSNDLAAGPNNLWYGNGVRYLPYMLYVPSGATPATPLPIMIFCSGQGEKGTNLGLGINGETASRLIGYSLGLAVDGNKGTVPQCFYLIAMQCGGPDDKTGVTPFNGLRASRSHRYAAFQDVLRSGYNVDMTRIHLAGYSGGAVNQLGFAIRYASRLKFASLSLFDGQPNAYIMTNEVDPCSDLFPASQGAVAGDYSKNAAMFASCAAVMGDIPLNYQHGANDGLSYALGAAEPHSLSGPNIIDYTIRTNDPVANPSTAFQDILGATDGGPGWFSTFAANGLTAPVQHTVATVGLDSYAPSTHSSYTAYTSYDHSGLGGNAFALSNPWWSWWSDVGKHT